MEPKHAFYSEVCLNCKHFNSEVFRKEDRHTCAAFQQIPWEIWDGENDHTQPFPGDNGIQFELRQF